MYLFLMTINLLEVYSQIQQKYIVFFFQLFIEIMNILILNFFSIDSFVHLNNQKLNKLNNRNIIKNIKKMIFLVLTLIGFLYLNTQNLKLKIIFLLSQLLIITNSSNSCPTQTYLECATTGQDLMQTFIVKSDATMKKEDILVLVYEKQIDLYQLSDYTKIVDIKIPAFILIQIFNSQTQNDCQIVVFAINKIYFFSVNNAALQKVLNLDDEQIIFDNQMCASADLGYFVSKTKEEKLVVYDYLKKKKHLLDDKLEPIFIFRCQFIVKQDEDTFKLVITENELAISLYESNKTFLNFTKLNYMNSEYQIFDWFFFDGNRLAVKSTDFQRVDYLHMINLNNFEIELVQNVNIQFQVYYSSIHKLWLTTYGSGSFYINGEIFNFEMPENFQIDISDSISTDTSFTRYDYQHFIKLAVNQEQSEIALISYQAIYLFSLPDFKFIAIKQITKKYISEIKQNYVYQENILIDFYKYHWQVYDTKRLKLIFDNYCIEGFQVFDELIVDIYLDLDINRLTILDLFGSGFFAKYDTGEPYFRFVSNQSRSQWLVLADQNLIIIWSTQQLSEVQFYDYLTGDQIATIFELNDYVIFNCYYPKSKNLLLVDYSGTLIVINIQSQQVIQKLILTQTKQFTCNKDDDQFFLLRTDNQVIKFQSIRDLNQTLLLSQLTQKIESTTQILYGSQKLFLMASTLSFPYVLQKMDFQTGEIIQILIKCNSPYLNVNNENYLTVICQDRVYIEGISDDNKQFKKYLNIPTQHQRLKFALIDDIYAFVINIYGVLLQFNLPEGKLVNTIELHSSYQPNTVLIDSVNKMLISGGSEGRIVKYSYIQKQIVKIWKSQEILVMKLDLVNNILIHSSSSFIYSRNYIDSDLTQQLIANVQAQKQLVIVDDDYEYVLRLTSTKSKILNGIFVYPDINVIVGYGDKLYFWDYIQMVKIQTVSGYHNKNIQQFEYVPQLKLIFSAGEDSIIVIYDSDIFEYISSTTLPLSCEGITQIALYKVNYIFIGCYSGEIYLYAIDAIEKKLNYKLENTSLEQFAINKMIINESKDEIYIYSLSWNGYLFNINLILQGIWKNISTILGIYGEIDFKRNIIVSIDQNGFLIALNRFQYEHTIYEQIHNGRIWDLKLVVSQGYVITVGDDKLIQIRNYVKNDHKTISTYFGKYQLRNIVFDEFANIVIVTDVNGGLLLLEYPSLFLKQEFRQETNSLTKPVGKWLQNILFTAFEYEGLLNIWNYEGLLRDTFIFESRKELGIINAQRNERNSSEIFYIDTSLQMMKWNCKYGTKDILGVIKNNEFPLYTNIFQVPSQNSLIFVDFRGIYHIRVDDLKLINYFDQGCISAVHNFQTQKVFQNKQKRQQYLFCQKEYKIIAYELLNDVELKVSWEINPPLKEQIEELNMEDADNEEGNDNMTIEEKIKSYIDLIKIDPVSNLLFFTQSQSFSIVVYNYQLKKYIYKKQDHSQIINNILGDYSDESSRRRIISYSWDGLINVYEFNSKGESFTLYKQLYLCDPNYMQSPFLNNFSVTPEIIQDNSKCIISNIYLAEDYLIAYTPQSFNNVKVFSYPDLEFLTCLPSPTNGYTLAIKTDKQYDMIVLASSFHYIIISYKTLQVKSNLRNLIVFAQQKIKDLIILSDEYILSQFSQSFFLIKVNEANESSKQIQKFTQQKNQFDRFSFNVDKNIFYGQDNLSIKMTIANSNSMVEFLLVVKGSQQCLVEFNPHCSQHCIKKTIKNIEQFNIISKEVYEIESFNFVFNLHSKGEISEFPSFEFSQKTNLTYQVKFNQEDVKLQQDGESKKNDSSQNQKEPLTSPPYLNNTDYIDTENRSFDPASFFPEQSIENRDSIVISPKFASSVSNFNSVTIKNMLLNLNKIQFEQSFENITLFTMKDVELTQFNTVNIRYFVFVNIKQINLHDILIQNQLIKKSLIFLLQSFDSANVLNLKIEHCRAIYKSTILQIQYVPQNISNMSKEFYLNGLTFYNNTYFDGSAVIVATQTKESVIKNVNATNNSQSSFMKSTILQLFINRIVFMSQINYQNNTGILFLISQPYYESRHQSLLETRTIFEDEFYIDKMTIKDNINEFDDSFFIQIISNKFQLNNFKVISNKSQQSGVLFILNSKGGLQNALFENNKSDLYSNLYISSSVIQIEDSEFISNNGYNGGVALIEKSEINISNCKAIKNEATDGGVMYIRNGLKNSRIRKFEFRENSSSGSGGCLVLDNSDIDLSENTFISNRAEIGGAVRYINLQPSFMRNPTSRLIQETENQEIYSQDSCGTYSSNFCSDNQGRLFGKNIGSYVSQIVQVEKQGNEEKLIEQKEFQKNLFKDIRSGQNEKQVVFELLDEFNQKVDFSNVNIQSMSPSLVQELKQFTTKLNKVPNQQQNYTKFSKSNVTDNFGNSNIQIDGDVFQDYFNGKFIFDQYSIEGIPNSQTVIKLEVNPLYVIDPQTYEFQKGDDIYLNVTFRNCEIGEIPLKSCPTCSTINCQECPLGTYSLENPEQATACMKCDYKTSVYCKKNIIKLRQGFWRENESTDVIHYCNNFPQSCNGNESTHYCSIGYIGPLCETCDYEGKVWGESYGKSNLVNNHIDSCQRCSDIKKQYLNFFISVLAIIVFVFIIIFEINRSQVNKLILNLIHISGMQVLGNSAFQKSQKTQLVKLFIHHILVLTAMQSFRFDIKFLDWFQIILSPFMFMNSTLDCILYQLSINFLPLHYMRLLYFNILILFLLFITYLAFKITYLVLASKKNDSEKISLQLYLNSKNSLISLLIAFAFIFQQNIIYSLFSVTSCRQIGQQYYISSYLTEKCYTQQYYTYSFAIVLPLLFIWAILFPFLLYYKIKISQILKPTFTNSVRQVGFMTCDYKIQNSHWEIFKIYIRIFIVTILCFFQNDNFRKGFYISIILMAYLQQLSKKKPYIQNEFQESDQICSFIEIIIMLLISYQNTIQNELEQQIIIQIVTMLSTFIFAFLLLKIVREIIISYLLNCQQQSLLKKIINNLFNKLANKINYDHPQLKQYLQKNVFSIYSIIFLRSSSQKKMIIWQFLRKQFLDFKKRKQDNENAKFFQDESQYYTKISKSLNQITGGAQQNKNLIFQLSNIVDQNIKCVQTQDTLETNQLKSKHSLIAQNCLSNLKKKRKFINIQETSSKSNIKQEQSEKEIKIIISQDSDQQLDEK
ncbi:transmembrane protein, putative (macronuclear) [Tetrahymena thermophila SB210]|uniref:Transmembrane protein, putative n=1 Tax=Tetrahymena thermophila (strain SB210) TaxID=312017 RepID=I7MKS0_TETTS|nr:transmembrane protein, putative [Tetrahymena thermophila SB210]EAR99914.2 transmembrane protein, putative [Tetrahymena thermophila SB210]|eukprot:XP_001020159.2 transmembrane protein, putative [Tetrahymena thermophila SB210]